jgi:hypothetical protein
MLLGLQLRLRQNTGIQEMVILRQRVEGIDGPEIELKEENMTTEEDMTKKIDMEKGKGGEIDMGKEKEDNNE